MRKALGDAIITENLVFTCLEALKGFREDGDVSSLTNKVTGVQKALCMIADSNARQLEHVLHAWASAKKLLRDAVLKDFIVPPQSFQVPNSTLKGHNLFGPFPESFEQAVRMPNSKLALSPRYKRSNFGSSYAPRAPSASPYSTGPSGAPVSKRPRPSAPSAGASGSRPSSARPPVTARRGFRKGRGGKNGNG